MFIESVFFLPIFFKTSYLKGWAFCGVFTGSFFKEEDIFTHQIKKGGWNQQKHPTKTVDFMGILATPLRNKALLTIGFP